MSFGRKLGNILLAGAISTGSLYCGCVSSIPLQGDPTPVRSIEEKVIFPFLEEQTLETLQELRLVQQNYGGEKKESSKRFALRYGMFASTLDIELGKEEMTVPIHPDDANAARDEGVVMDSDRHMYSLFVGFERIQKLGTRLAWRAGVDAKITAVNGVRETKLQNLPDPYESYGYSVVPSGHKTITPFVGIDIKLDGNKVIGFDMGVPFSRGGKYVIGHYRWDDWEPIAEYSWDGFGRSATIRLGTCGEITDFFGLMYTVESYPVHRSGEKSSIFIHSITLGIQYDF
ncbi:MAG TPA: hypothetical protein VJA47_00700 [archaeon]|nr:hypothetical protein [archaeon]